MKWEALIIPLIGLAVWILSTIFRGREEQQQERTRRPGTDRGAVRPPRRPATELDRFLEEARARRKPVQTPGEQDRPEPAFLEALPVAKPPERPRDVRPATRSAGRSRVPCRRRWRNPSSRRWHSRLRS